MNGGNGPMLPPQPSASKRLGRPSLVPGHMGRVPRQSMASNSRPSMISRPSLLPGGNIANGPGMGNTSFGSSRQSFAPPRHTPSGSQNNNTISGSNTNNMAISRQQHIQHQMNGLSNNTMDITSMSGLGPGGPTMGGVTLSEMMNASVQRTNNARKSFAPSGPGGPGGSSGVPNSVSRNSRQSNFGIYGSGTPISSSSAIPTNSFTRDSRPLRDKNYIAFIQQSLYEYFQSHNFAQETKHPLTTKTLRTPTQKDFVMIFKWLYNKLDPGYRFTRSIEHEVYFLLKAIHYPFLDSINKSQISAVGGQNWPVYLAMLHWLMELNMTLEVYDNRQYPGASNDDNVLDKIFFTYLTKSYAAFLNLQDDYTQYQEEMKAEFEQYSEELVRNIQILAEENEILEQKFDELNKNTSVLESLEKKGEVLNTDLEKFKTYIDRMQSHKIKWTKTLQNLADELEEKEQSLRSIQEEKSLLDSQIDAQDLKPADIDALNSEREKLAKSLDLLTERLDDMEKIYKEKQHVAQSNLRDLESTISKYMKFIYSLRIESSSQLGKVLHNDPTFFAISLESPLAEENLSLQKSTTPQEIRIHREIRPSLLEYRNETNKQIHETQDEILRVQDALDTITESNREKMEQADSLNAKLNAATIDYETVYDTVNSDTTASNSEIEKMDRRVRDLKNETSSGSMQLKQRSQTVTMEYDKFKRNVQLTRQSMYSELERMINIIIDFKIHVQKSLESYEAFVVDEWEGSKNLE